MIPSARRRAENHWAATQLVCVGRPSLLLFRLRPTDGADRGLATGGFPRGLFGAPLGSTLSHPSHFSARSFAAGDGLS